MNNTKITQILNDNCAYARQRTFEDGDAVSRGAYLSAYADAHTKHMLALRAADIVYADAKAHAAVVSLRLALEAAIVSAEASSCVAVFSTFCVPSTSLYAEAVLAAEKASSAASTAANLASDAVYLAYRVSVRLPV